MQYLNEQQTIGTNAINVLPDRQSLNQKRTSFILTNTSTGAQVITITIDKEATTGAGIVLYAGGSIERTTNLIPIPQQKISAISSAIGATLAVYEEVL
jgi:hypothetical protein